MREDQQRRTTVAAEALLGPVKLGIRRALLPMIVAETPFILRIQKFRTPLRDTYFKSVSFVGSHIFYMLWLPTMFWFGLAQYGRHLTILLALTLWVCNYVKDSLCLPRPTSPPIVKLASNLYSIEYGFPSAHSMNAVVMGGFSAIYCIQHAYASTPLPPLWAAAVWAGAIFFIINITFSRLYCGMHTVTDLIGGVLFGVLLLAVWLANYDAIEGWLTSSPYVFPLICLFAAFLSWIYPDPVDPTPSYDDTVSFIWVMAGVSSGTRTFVGHPLSTSVPAPANILYSFEELGLVLSAARVLLGVAIIVLWRMVAKRALFLVLPPIYRFLGLRARKYFLAASEYKDVDRPIHATPSVLHLDAIPQESASEGNRHKRSGSKGTAADSDPARSDSPAADGETALRHAFHRLPRYDVEVVTRCIVYFGIGYLAVFGIPVIFANVGLAPPA